MLVEKKIKKEFLLNDWKVFSKLSKLNSPYFLHPSNYVHPPLSLYIFSISYLDVSSQSLGDSLGASEYVPVAVETDTKLARTASFLNVLVLDVVWVEHITINTHI